MYLYWTLENFSLLSLDRQQQKYCAQQPEQLVRKSEMEGQQRVSSSEMGGEQLDLERGWGGRKWVREREGEWVREGGREGGREGRDT